jgi:hypothetical protein
LQAPYVMACLCDMLVSSTYVRDSRFTSVRLARPRGAGRGRCCWPRQPGKRRRPMACRMARKRQACCTQRHYVNDRESQGFDPLIHWSKSVCASLIRPSWQLLVDWPDRRTDTATVVAPIRARDFSISRATNRCCPLIGLVFFRSIFICLLFCPELLEHTTCMLHRQTYMVAIAYHTPNMIHKHYTLVLRVHHSNASSYFT